MTAPPQIGTSSELLLAELGKLLTVEETLLKRLLPQLVHDVQDEQLRTALAEHLEQTRGHVGNLQEAFLTLSAVPAGKPAPGLDGLILERESAISDVDPAMRAGFDCAAAMGTEHYEINAYEAAIRLSDALGAEQVGGLLRSNLEQEVAALQRLGKEADRLAKRTADKN
jgi:ferritin-like metal-binding protein YciE